MKFERQSMTKWYNVKLLAATGIKTVISTLFGNFADKREIQAALSDEDAFHYENHQEIWIDYISDLGDGFNSTYTMAHLMAQEELNLNGEILKRGSILIMGGDEVYPTPEKSEYENRLQGPYNAAFPWKEEDLTRPHLFAIPGNHDWYDGLSNFIKLFCQGRALGNWHSQQKRSYFALKLPHNIWIWGLDVQLNADIDQPQLTYFTNITKEMIEGDKVILCTAEPSWVYRSINSKDASYKRLQFFKEKFFLSKKNINQQEPDKKIKLLATLTGDLHHYSRYSTIENGEEQNQLITAGGGGAFMHPTHFLKEKIQIEDDPALDLKKVYPSKDFSQKLSFLNLVFPFYNWGLPLTITILYLIAVWYLGSSYSNARHSFIEQLQNQSVSFHNIIAVAAILWKSSLHNPTAAILNLLFIAAIIFITDRKSEKQNWNLVFGIPHGTLQFISFYFLLWLFVRTNSHLLNLEINSIWNIAILFIEMIVAGSLCSGVIFGSYLCISTLALGAHPTEAFSSLRWTGYKNFLRIHISPDAIKIYPIGVKQVVTNWKDIGTSEKPQFKGDEIKYELIEDPIVIKNR